MEVIEQQSPEGAIILGHVNPAEAAEAICAASNNGFQMGVDLTPGGVVVGYVRKDDAGNYHPASLTPPEQEAISEGAAVQDVSPLLIPATYVFYGMR